MKGGMITRINNELKAIEENFSIEELFFETWDNKSYVL